MMTGVRVTGIPEEVTEKQLKVYFSNPNNGGGAVRHIYYPLQNNCAVILFESPSGGYCYLSYFRLGQQEYTLCVIEKITKKVEKT